MVATYKLKYIVDGKVVYEESNLEFGPSEVEVLEKELGLVLERM